MARNNMRISEKETVGDKILYAILKGLFYSVKYLTLIPFFLINHTFIRKPLTEKSSICISENKDEKTFRNADFVDNLNVGFENCKSITDLIKNCSLKNPTQNMLGSRKVIKKVDYTEEITGRELKQIEFGPYVWKTAEEVVNIVTKYAYGLTSIGASKDENTKVAIFADNCEEWFVTAQAILLSGCQIVTVYPTLSNEGIIDALTSTKVTHIVVDEKTLKRFMQFTNKFEFLKTVILMSTCSEEQSQNHFIFHKIEDLYEKGEELMNLPEVTPLSQTEGDDIAIIMFTSGSTGNPKGVLLSHQNVLTQIGSEMKHKKDWENNTFIAFLPSAHILEFVVELSVLGYGGCCGFSTPLTLTDKSPMIMPGTKGDLTELKPSFAIFVPLLLDRMSKSILEFFRQQTKFKQVFIQFLIDYKTDFLSKGHTTPFVDKLVFKKVSQIVGGNMKLTISAGAPICSELALFCSVVFCLNLKQGYGTTETACAGSLGKVNDPYTYDVGAITPTVDIKFVSWEEGGYHVNDEPYSRGEIYIGGESVSQGYYNNDELTRESFEVDENNKKWFKTGDIGQILPNGNLQIIDRKKDIIKLRHGEYVSISSIECTLMQSRFVDSICVAPNSDSSYLIAIIVPNRQQIASILKTENKEIDDDFSVHINDIFIRKIMTRDVQNISASLNKFDRPEKYIFVTDLWTPENGLMTPSMKIKRAEVHRFYSHFLD